MIAPLQGIVRGKRPMRALPLAIVLLALCFLVPARVGAQQDSAPASLRGTVTDGATGTALEGAEVVISGPKTVTTWSDAQGTWRAAGLPPGRYRIRSRRIGYAARELSVDLRPGDDLQRRITLVAVPRSLDEVVVTAARREQALKDVAVTTEVVTRREIEQTGASDLASILTEQLGIELQGGHPAGAGIMLQGLGSERVLVLLDGQPVAGRISGVFDVSRIPSSVIERVEVVKGPQSTLYGSEAMGGVVNIITRSPLAHTLGASASVSAGTQGRLEGTAGLIAGKGALSSALNASRRETELTPGRGSEIGALAARTDVAAKLIWSPDSMRSLEASLLALDERQRWKSGTYFNFGDNTQVSGRLTGSWQRGRHRVVPTLYASIFDHLSRASTEPLPIAGDTGQRQLQRLFEAEVLYNTQFGAQAHALDLGVELRRDDTRSDNVPGGRRALMTVEPFAQLELRAAAFSVVPGVRMSWSEQWGTHVTPRLALRYELSDAVTLRASAGSGFRAPDFKELYMFFQNMSAGYAVQGNLDLRPESSRNLTTGVEWAGERVYLRGQLFQNDFRDFIETRPINAPDEAPLYRYVNVDDGWTRGAELESGLSLGRLRMEAGYSRLDTRDRATGKSLLGRPEQSGRIGANYALPSGLRLSVTAIHTGLTPMRRNVAVLKSTQPQAMTLLPAGVLTSWREGFTRADVRIAHRIPGGLQLAIGADNVFDQRPTEWAGFAGRQLYTTLTWNFERSDAPED